MKKVLRRFVDVWKLDFLAKFFAGEYRDTRTTIVFWILSNIMVVFIFTMQIFFGLLMVKDDLVNGIQKNVNDGAAVAFFDGQLTIENVEDPFFREVKATNDDGQGANFVVIIDQRADTYDLNALDEYASGMIFLHDRAYMKDGSDITQVLYADVPNFSLSKEQLLEYFDRYYIFPFSIGITIVAGVFMLFFFLCLRTIGALWWALMLYVIGLVMNVHMAYSVAYKSTLNLYFVPMIVVTLVTVVAGTQIPLLTTVIFIAVFVANLLWFKKHMKKEETVENEVIIPAQVNTEENISTSVKK